jgi:hypothetical protein
MDSLQYTSLEPSKKQIRLLRLLDGEWDDTIKCELHIVSLDDELMYEVIIGKSIPSSLKLFLHYI